MARPHAGFIESAGRQKQKPLGSLPIRGATLSS
jgi:hypothetical protein